MTERGHRLRRIAASIAGDQADDAVQAACLGFLRAFEPGAAHGGYEGAYRYLARATANSASKLIRSDQRRRRGLPPVARLDEYDEPVERAIGDAPDPSDVVLRSEEIAVELALLASLPEDQQRVLIDRAAGYSPQEIQQRIGISSRQYRKRIEKANRCLEGGPNG